MPSEMELPSSSLHSAGPRPCSVTPGPQEGCCTPGKKGESKGGKIFEYLFSGINFLLKSFPTLPAQDFSLTSWWLELYHMAAVSCKRSWEIHAGVVFLGRHILTPKQHLYYKFYIIYIT